MERASRRGNRLLARHAPALRGHVGKARTRDGRFGRPGDCAKRDCEEEIEVHASERKRIKTK